MPASPTSPTRPRRSHSSSGSIPGFISPPRPKQRPIQDLTIPELYEKHARNQRILSNPAPSTSSYVQRLSTEQAAIEARLTDLVGVEKIQEMLKRTTISEDENMRVDEDINTTPHPQIQDPRPLSRTIETKRRILSNYSPLVQRRGSTPSTFTFEEAARIEQEAHAQDQRRRQEAEERKRRKGLPIKGEMLTRQEQEARMWAFMNYKPTGSDLEDEDEDESVDDDDPASWFDDDQDDGRKGQDIVEPDSEDYSNIIRIDESRIPRSMFYEPRDDN